MADATVTFLLENVTQLLIREVGMIQGVAPAIESLKLDLAQIRQFLHDSSGKREHVKEVVNAIQTVANEAEDVIDKFVVDLARHKRKSKIDRFFHKVDHNFMLRGVASKIKIIKAQIVAIYSSKEMYGIVKNDDSRNEVIHTRENLIVRRRHVEEVEVVSFLKDAKIVMDTLNSDHSSLDVVSIIGMGGLGKTTLAKKIYNDTNVKSRFSCRAWANVSEDFHPTGLFLHILESIPKSKEEMEGIPEMNEEYLANKVRRLLQDKKYLIVLDDVWKPEVWTRIKGAFPDTENGSRILITSRIKEVAAHACRTPPYMLPLLNNDDSWELLSKKAFGSAACPLTLESKGRKIAEKCKGLPLALVVVGGLLAKKDKSNLVWSQMVDNVSWYLEKNPESFSDVLALSYQELPAHLKRCFLYLGVYPEDYEMSARQLIRLWIAERLVEQDSRRMPEDIADEYLQDLADRSLIMVMRRRCDGGIKSFSIHDLLRDLCIAEAAEDNFFVVHDGEGYIKSCNNRPRRISLLCNTSGYSSSSVQTDSSLARSLLCFSDTEEKFPSFVFKDFRLTRVLCFGSPSIVFKEIRLTIILDNERNTPLKFKSSLKYDLSPKFDKLVLLRYLCLGHASAHEFPSFICNLPNLQTLDLRGSYVEYFGRHFWNMQQLRHLLTHDFALSSDSLSHMKPMPNLQTLVDVTPRLLYDCKIEIAFPNLRRLVVNAHTSSIPESSEPRFTSSNSSILESSKPRLGNVQTLKIRRKCDLLSHGGVLSSRLTKLTLLYTKLSDEQFSSLSLPNLEILKLQQGSLGESTRQFTNNSLCKLEVLHMMDLKVDRWWIDGECLSNLNFLQIHHCYELKMAPQRLKVSTTPRLIKLSFCDSDLLLSFYQLRLSENTRIETEDVAMPAFRKSDYFF